MGMKDKLKRAGAAAAIVTTVHAAPDQKPANIAVTNNQAKAAMRDRANKRAARLRTETGAKGSRIGGSGKTN